MRNLLETRALHIELMNHNVTLEGRVHERTQELSQTVKNLQAAHEELRSSRTETIERLAVAAEFRDDETASHIQRMSQYCGLLAKEAGADDSEADELRVASIMHDVGKIGIPDGILLKPGPLTETSAPRYRPTRRSATGSYRHLNHHCSLALQR